jgi:hypothetical protein
MFGEAGRLSGRLDCEISLPGLARTAWSPIHASCGIGEGKMSPNSYSGDASNRCCALATGNCVCCFGVGFRREGSVILARDLP